MNLLRLKYGQLRRYNGYRPVKVRYSVVYMAVVRLYSSTEASRTYRELLRTTADIYGYITAVRMVLTDVHH